MIFDLSAEWLLDHFRSGVPIFTNLVIITLHTSEIKFIMLESMNFTILSQFAKLNVVPTLIL